MTEWSPAYSFDEYSIERHIELPALIGNYRLGTQTPRGFETWYIGRADGSLLCEIRDHLGEISRIRCVEYPHFQFRLAEGETQEDRLRNIYEQDCNDYHELSKITFVAGQDKSLDNETHPKKCANMDYKCPECGE